MRQLHWNVTHVYNFKHLINLVANIQGHLLQHVQCIIFYLDKNFDRANVDTDSLSYIFKDLHSCYLYDSTKRTIEERVHMIKLNFLTMHQLGEKNVT